MFEKAKIHTFVQILYSVICYIGLFQIFNKIFLITKCTFLRTENEILRSYAVSFFPIFYLYKELILNRFFERN